MIPKVILVGFSLPEPYPMIIIPITQSASEINLDRVYFSFKKINANKHPSTGKVPDIIAA